MTSVADHIRARPKVRVPGTRGYPSRLSALEAFLPIVGMPISLPIPQRYSPGHPARLSQSCCMAQLQSAELWTASPRALFAMWLIPWDSVLLMPNSKDPDLGFDVDR